MPRFVKGRIVAADVQHPAPVAVCAGVPGRRIGQYDREDFNRLVLA